MPDFQQQQPTLPPLPQQQQPALQTPAPPQLTPMDRINQATQDLQKTLPNWVNSNFVTPYQTRLDQTLRYNDPNIGYNPMDANLEDKYAQAHYLKTFGNNLLQGGARFLGTAAEAIATIPLAVDAVVNKDFTKLYDNDLTNSIHQWFNTLDTTLPVYQTNYEQQHPILKYLNPLQPKALLGAFGNAFNNFGFTAGAIAGSLVEDAVVTAATGGPGLFPALAANGVQFTKMLARASRAIVGGAEDVKTALKAGEAVADAATAGEVSTVLRNRVGEGIQDVGSNINSQNLTNFDEVLASQKTQELKQAIANNATYFKIRDAAKYNLALLTSATAEASFEAVDVYHRGLDQLKQQYFEEYGTVPTGDDLQRIERISHQSANIDMGANIGFLYMMNRVNWGSLFKPTTQAFDEAITGWGGSIARTTVTKDAEAAVGNSAYKVISNAPETKIGKILLNGEKLYKIGFQSINEAIEEGSQFIMSEGSMDYNMRKYNAKHRGDVVDGMASFLAGVDKTFNTNEGWDNMMGGFVGGIFGTEIMHKVLEGRGQTSAQKQMQIQADLLNQASFNGTFENKIQEAAVQTSLAEDHKDAVQQQDKLGAKNIKFNMLYNWVTSGIRANSFDKRMEELDAVRDLQGKSFQDYWGKEDNTQNRAEVNGFLDNLQRQANNIKDVYTRIDRLTKNPYDQKANPLDHEAYNSYKDQLALNIALSDNYRERINDMQTELHKVSPLMDIQKAVNLTSIAGLRDTLTGIDKAQSDLAEQIQMAKEAKTDPELTANLINKHKALTKLFAELQPLVTDSKTGEQSNNVTESAFDGKKYVDVLQKLYALHDGSSFLNNKYINKFAQPAIHINQEGEAEVVSHDELAEHLQTLQDIYSLSKANLNVQRFYNFLRKGAGATEFMDTLKRVNLEQLAKYMNKEGEIKSPAELQDEIEQDIRFKTPEPENVEEATKEERDIITQAAKKVVSGDELTDKEKDVTTQKPQRFAHEVKIQEATQQQVNERFGEQAEPTTDNTIKPTVRSKIKVKDLFGMFSQDHNTTKNRSNLYKAIFKSPEVFSKLTATYAKAEPQTTFFKLIPNTKIFRSEFKDNITIFHNGQPIGILRPQDSLWLDEGKRTIYDMTPEEFTDVTGHPAEQYQAFMDELRAYQTAYNNFKQALINSKDNVALTFDDINKFFDLSINTGAAVQNRYTITNAKGKFQVVDPKNVVVQNFNTLAQAQTWIKQNNNTLSRYDTLLKDLNYKPKGTALISFVNNIDLGGGTTVEPNIVNKDQLTQQQLSNVISFLANNADHFKNNANRYVVLLPIDNQYSLKAAIFARNADATHDEQQDYFNKIKQVASGLITGDKLNDLINDLYAKYFVANQDRTVKQTFITTTFSEDGNLILSINNPSQKVYKNIVINKAEIQNTTTYGDLMKLLQSNINNESIKDTGLAKLQIQLTEDSLKRQIPDDEDITKLSQIDTKLRLATTPDIFSNYTINFTPKGYAATEETPSAKPTEQVAQTEVKPEVQDAAKAVRDEYLQKRAALQKGFNDSLTPAEKSIKQTLTTNPALAKDTTNLLKQANATQADLLSYSKKASQYNEQFRVYQAIEQQKLANPTNTDVAIYARTKAGVETIAKDLFNLKDEQANAVADIYDANAQAWAARTGNSVADYYKQLGFKSQLDQNIDDANILEQSQQFHDAVQNIAKYLGLDYKQAGANFGGFVKNGMATEALYNRINDVIAERNLQNKVGVRLNLTNKILQFYNKEAQQQTLFQNGEVTTSDFNDAIGGVFNPLTGEILLGNLGEVKISKFDGRFYLDDIRSFEKQKGAGTKLLNTVTQAADKLGVDLHLSAINYNKNAKDGLNKQQLVDFYKRHGFKVELGQYGIDTEKDILKYVNSKIGKDEPVEMVREAQQQTLFQNDTHINDSDFQSWFVDKFINNYDKSLGNYDNTLKNIVLTPDQIKRSLIILKEHYNDIIEKYDIRPTKDIFGQKQVKSLYDQYNKAIDDKDESLIKELSPDIESINKYAFSLLYIKGRESLNKIAEKNGKLTDKDFEGEDEGSIMHVINTESKYGETSLNLYIKAQANDFAKNPELLNQNAKAAYNTLTNTIYALTNPDVTSPLHELAHNWEQQLTKTERKTVLDWAKSNTWTRDTSERFASGFELYLSEGKAPTTALEKVFKQFAAWLADVVKKVQALFGKDFKLNNDMRGIYAKMLNGDLVKEEQKVEVSAKQQTAQQNTPLTNENNIDFIEQPDGSSVIQVKDNNGQVIKNPNTADGSFDLQSAKDFIKEYNSKLQPQEEQAAAPKVEEPQQVVSPNIITPLTEADKTNYGKISQIQKDIANGFYEQQIRDGKLTAEQVKAILKSAGLNENTVEGMVFKINNPDLIKALQQGIPTGINVKYLRSDINAAIKDGRFGEAIRNGELTEEHAKNILDYFGINQSKFKQDFEAAAQAQQQAVTPTEQAPLTDSELSFINLLKENQADLTGIHGNIIKDLLDMEDYRQVIDMLHNYLQADTNQAKVIFNNPAVYKAFLQLVNKEEGDSEAGDVLAAHAKDVYEPEEQTPTEQVAEQLTPQEKYIHYKEAVNGEVVQKIGKVVEDNGFTSLIETPTGEQFDRVTAQLTPATKEEFDALKPAEAKPTSVDNGKYNPGDKVIYGQNNDVYTIEYPTTIPNDSGVEEIYYTTEEGPVIKESGIRDLARKTKVTEILQEHKGLEKRKATLERIAKRFTQLFPDIKYLIGDFDFNAPARFNKGVVEVNVSYQIANDKSISRERMANKLAELEAQKDAGMDYNKKLYADLTSKLQSGLNFYNVDEANAALYKDAFTTPWLKREAVAHEFMHPFILALKQSNSVLYNNLINELNKTQKPILDHVDNLIKSGTYSEENRNDEALAIYLGKSITDAFDKNGELKPDYVIGAKKRLFRRFLDWLTDIIDYLRGKRKTIKLEDFIKNANSDIDAQRDLIRSLIKEAPLLQELYSTKHKSDLIKTINYVKRTMGEAFNEDGSINEEHFNTGLQHLVDELSSKQQQQSAKAAKLDAKVFERPSGENPVYRVVVNGEDRFIQRQENLGGVAQWFEVVKRKELWEAPNGKTGTEADGLLGDSKVEALENLGKEVNPIKAANPEKLSQLADAISNFLQQKPTGRFEFIISPSEDTDVKFDETDPEHIKVYIDPDFADDITAPSTLLRYGQRDIIDNDAAEEFKNLVQRNYYMAGNYKDREASIGVKTLNPLMSLQDVSDFIVKQLNDKEYNIKYTNPELDAIDELEAYMELTEPEAAKIRERVVKRLQQLKDVAEVRLNNHTLKNEYNIVKGISLDESDVDFVLKYIERAGIGINLAWRKYNELRQDLQDPNLTQATLNRLNKDLDVVKQLVSFYDDFSQLYNNYEDEFNDEDLTKFRKSVANWQRLRDSMNETAINLAVKWMLPYAEKHNEYIKQQGYTDPKYFVTQKTLYDNFKYGADKDTNFITYNLGANVTSRDPVNAIFANIVADMLSINNINIVNNAFDVNEGYAQFLKDHNISANSSKAQVEYYKTHYMRHAEILQSKYDEKTNTYKDEYVKKLALHQEFYFDQYQKDLAAEREKYKNPRNSEEAEQFTEALNRWQLDHNYGKTEKYRNKQYTALQNDKFFKLLEHHYNESNAKYGENKLQYGIIPQKYDVGTIERLKRIVQAGKSKEGLREVMDKAQMHLAGIKKDNTSLNLDDTLHRVVRSELTQAKEERNLDLNLHNSIIDMITEATNYASLKEVQYNVENLRSLIEGNHKFNIDSRKIAKQDFEANVRNSIQLRNAKVEFKALNKLKDAGQPYDEARYKQLEEKIAKGAPKLKLWDRLAGTVKSSETARLNDQLIQFINDTFYGESVEEEKLGKISLNKAAHYLSMYTSINNMAFNTIAGVSNVVIGDVQMMIEAHGGKYFNKKDLAWATADYYKNMANYLGDLKNPIKSKDTQISFLLDAIQGEIQDEFGTRISGNITRRMFNAGSLFFFTSVGEHQIQTIGMKAMLKAKKVTTDDGKTISLYDAYVKDANGRYSLRKDINFTNDDLQHFIRQLHGVNRSLNGNYSDLHKSTLQRKWYGTLMLKFRKYIYEAFRTRYSSEHTDFEKNTVEQGYMNFFLNDYLYKNFKNLPWNQKFAFISNYNKLNENQKYAMRKAGMELGIFLGAMILTMAFFGGGDPEHKKDLTTAQKTLLLYSLRLQNDLGMFHVQMPSEFVRQTKSPTASMTSIVSLANLLGQLYKPTEVYQQSGNGHEAGDNKLMAKFKKMLPVISKFPIDVDSKLGYFNMVNQNIQGVSPKQSF